MTRCNILVLSSAMVTVVSLAAQPGPEHAVAAPYGGIVASNVFRLRPPESHLADPPAAPRASVRLVGTTGLLGKPLALLDVHVAASPPEPAQQFFSTLAEGQRDRGVQVVRVDARAGRVFVDGIGGSRELTFAEEAAPGSREPAPAPLPILRRSLATKQ